MSSPKLQERLSCAYIELYAPGPQKVRQSFTQSYNFAPSFIEQVPYAAATSTGESRNLRSLAFPAGTPASSPGRCISAIPLRSWPSPSTSDQSEGYPALARLSSTVRLDCKQGRGVERNGASESCRGHPAAPSP